MAKYTALRSQLLKYCDMDGRVHNRHGWFSTRVSHMRVYC